MYEGVMLSKTDSAREQINEMPIAISTNNMSSSTLAAVGSAKPSAAHTACGNIKVVSTVSRDNDLKPKPKRGLWRIVGGGSAETSLRQARGRHKRGINIKVVDKLGNLNIKEKKGIEKDN